ncbi:MAG: hypothetical protein AAF921_03615 [Cyanobacteria bacterium P01_D01_bin.44]
MDAVEDKSAKQTVYKSRIYQRKNGSLKTYLKLSSSLCALAGGSLVASNTAISAHGFLLLVFSSSQLLVASILDKDLPLIFYSGSVFVFVDCLGVYRWLLS